MNPHEPPMPPLQRHTVHVTIGLDQPVIDLLYALFAADPQAIQAGIARLKAASDRLKAATDNAP